MTRSQWFLGGALALQFLLILFFRSPFTEATQTAAAEPLVPVLAAITATRIELSDQETTVTLEKEGDGWRVRELDGFPADASQIDSLMDDLEQLQVRRPVVKSSRYHAAFKVKNDDNEARLRMWDEAGDDPQVDLIFGSSANYRAIHVRRAAEDPVYEVRGIAAYDVRASTTAWIEKALVDVSQDEVRSFLLTNASGTIEVEKQDDGWKVVAPDSMKEDDLDQDKVEALVRAAATLRLAEGVGPEDRAAHGFDRPAATIDLRLASEETISVQVGSKVADQETQRYVTRSGYGFTGTVWESSVRTLLEDKVGDLKS